MKIIISILVSLFLAAQAQASGSAASGGGAGGRVNSKSSPASSQKVKEVRDQMRQRILDKVAKEEQQKKWASKSYKFDHSYKEWDEILQKNILLIREGQASALNYSGVDLTQLKAFNRKLLKTPQGVVEGWKKAEKYSFYINLYNSLTVERILTKYPDLKSIKELGSGFPLFRSPWKIEFFSLFGQPAYLDKIEHELVREAAWFDEPRVHFAFNCASIGCPALLNRAFTPEKFEIQLEQATKNFLKDRERNRFDPKKKRVYLSKVLKWYRGDFEKGHKGFRSLKDFVAKYAETLADKPEHVAVLKKGKFKLEFTDYDWNLNDTKKQGLKAPVLRTTSL